MEQGIKNYAQYQQLTVILSLSQKLPYFYVLVLGDVIKMYQHASSRTQPSLSLFSLKLV